MRRTTFWERGLPHQLLVISDLSRALREEERQAWQRIVRVIGHELNNSLAPIKSIAGRLENLLSPEPRPDDWQDDMARGLGVIATRAEALSRFMQAYARLARLPRPQIGPVDVGAWVRRVVRLEMRMKVSILPGPELTIQADGDQLDQLLINLLRNAVVAAQETGSSVRVGWIDRLAEEVAVHRFAQLIVEFQDLVLQLQGSLSLLFEPRRGQGEIQPHRRTVFTSYSKPRRIFSTDNQGSGNQRIAVIHLTRMPRS